MAAPAAAQVPDPPGPRRQDPPAARRGPQPPTPAGQPPQPGAQPPVPPPPGEQIDGGAGVINREGDQPLDPRFDPATLGRAAEQPKPEEQNVIQVDRNYEKEFPCRRVPLDQMMSIDFKDLPMQEFVRLMACLTGKRFMLAQGVSGKITIMSPEPVTMYEAYKAFLSALEANNLTIVRRGAFLRIVPKTKARTSGAAILTGGQRPPDTDTMITQLIQIKHVMAEEVKELITNFATDGADITVYNPTNTLIITEVGSNIARLRRLIRQVDKPTGAVRIWVRPIQFATAAEIQKQVEAVFGKGSQAPARGRTATRRPARPSTRPTPGKAPATPARPATGGSLGARDADINVHSDERTNQLILITDRATYMRIDKFIRRIDVPLPGEGQIHIHHLQNANAKDVQTTLQALTGSSRGSTARRNTRAKSGRRTTRTKGAATPAAAGGGAALLGDDIKITAHEQTNSLVIEASLKDYLTLRRVIRQLDVRRKQVYLESVIMEITSDKDTDIGVTGYGGASFEVDGQQVPLIFGDSLGPDISGFQEVMPGGLGAMLLGPLIDASLGSTGSGSSPSTISIPAFGFTLRALQSNSDVNILQTPHILTTDNEEAEIEVGRRVPFNSGIGGLGGLSGLGLGGLSGLGSLGAAAGTSGLGSLASLGSTLGAMSGLGTIQYADIKISLKIKPTVNESNFVRLEIEQQIDDFDGIDQRTGAPNTSNRRVKNIVVVRDQQPVVIGGLMNDREVEGVRKIPILGDIPLLGALFRQTTTKIERKNLLMVIIPHIIDDPSDLKRIHEQRMDEIRRFAEFMATRRKEYMGQINFSKRHGLLHEMNRVVGQARRERYQAEQQLFDESELDPVGPPETHDLDYDPYEIESQRGSRGRGNRGSNRRSQTPPSSGTPSSGSGGGGSAPATGGGQ